MQLICLLAASAALLITSMTLAQDNAAPGNDRLHQTMQAIREQMDQLRRENQQIMGEIDDLESRNNADWLTQARADEIRGIVQDVLADADTRSNLLQSGIQAGWNERFFLSDASGRFLLQLDGMMQTRFIYNYRDQADNNRTGFEVTRTRLTFRGHVFSEFQYLVRGEFSPYPPSGVGAGIFALLDSWMRYNINDNWRVRAGQFKLPFMREELVSEAEQLAVERSLVTENFTAGRSAGVELNYFDDANSLTFALSNGATPRGILSNAAVLGSTLNTGAIGENSEVALTARYERLLAGTWSQFDDFTSKIGEEYGALFGLALHLQKDESTETPIIGDNDSFGIGGTADYSIEWGGANAFISGVYYYVDSPTVQILHFMAVVAQVGVYVTPKWELFARGEYGQLENAGGSVALLPDFGIITLGFNYYLEGHDVKWTTDVGFSITEISGLWISNITNWRDANDTAVPEIVFRSQLQILF